MDETCTDMKMSTATQAPAPAPEDTHPAALDAPGIIPFVDDEDGVSGGASDVRSDVTPEDLGESASEAFGELRRPISAVDRDLGLGNAAQRTSRGRYACPCCGQGAKRVMRVRVADYQQGHGRWVALCAVCAASMLARMPGTIVGGVVRPTRRRRTNRTRIERKYAYGFRAGAQRGSLQRAG